MPELPIPYMRERATAQPAMDEFTNKELRLLGKGRKFAYFVINTIWSAVLGCCAHFGAVVIGAEVVS